MQQHTSLSEKLGNLRSILLECGSVCVGYSGGVDSVFLAKFAVDQLGAHRVLAVTGISAAVPEATWQTARDCAVRFGIPHLEVDTDELADPAYRANPSNRCYFCKTELWSVLTPIAAEHGLGTVVDGSNADDAHDYRPGFKAAQEWGVRSPLMEADLSKQEIRAASRALDLPTWDQPSSPCLSSRLPYGLAVTPERLRQVERAEAALRALGFREFRVRHHGDSARLEFARAEFGDVARLAAPIAQGIRRSGFEKVLLDVEGYRSGRLNEGLKLVQLGGVGH